MLSSTLFLALCASVALAIVSHADDGKLALSDSESEKEDLRDISLKEVCYRNLYADIDAFTVKHSTETLISDSNGKTVFLSDGLKKAYDDVEYYYEEFCYKKVKARQRSNDVAKHSGLLVGRHLTAPVAQAGLLSSFGENIGGVPHSSADAILADRSTAPNGDEHAQGNANGKTGASEAPMILRLKVRQVGSGALAGGDTAAFSPSAFMASLNRTGATSSSGALGGGAGALTQPLRPGEGPSAPQLDDAGVGKGKGVERRSPSPGWIVRVLRIVSVQWDGHDETEEVGEGEGEGCEDFREEERGVDDGPQGGLLFE
ncbi:hypothetical protein JCM8208_000382 [Rhodotorula glutinis]